MEARKTVLSYTLIRKVCYMKESFHMVVALDNIGLRTCARLGCWGAPTSIKYHNLTRTTKAWVSR